MRKLYKNLLITGWAVVFVGSLIMNLPATLVGKLVTKYSNNRLALYNVQGTLWSGSGLLVASDPVTGDSSPLILVDWKLSLGFKHYVTLSLTTGKASVAKAFIDKNGAHLSGLDLYLSLIQISKVVPFVKNMGISGNVHLLASQIDIGKKLAGDVKLVLDNISANIVPINPLGDYQVTYNLGTSQIKLITITPDVLDLSGEGSLTSLELKAKVVDSAKDKMAQYMTAMGQSNSDGSHNIKIF